MTHRSPRYISLLILLVAPAMAFAQETSSAEEERLEKLARENNAEWYAPKNSLTVGFRVLSSGTNVTFGKLGSVPFSTNPAALSAGLAKRVYDNGTVDLDALRFGEMDVNGNQTSTPGGRYQNTVVDQVDIRDANGNITGTVYNTVVVGDFLSFTPGATRVWSYKSQQQSEVRPGYIAMSSYSASSDGTIFEKKQGMAAGVELQFAHTLGKITKRVEWGMVAGITLNSINNKTAGDLAATLNTLTDYYALNGPAPVALVESPYAGPSFVELPTPPGRTLPIPDGLETTVSLSAEPDKSLSTGVPTSTVGGATVHGRYQVKGAYFMMRLGPSLRTQLTERLGLSASLGVAGAYAGTHYSATESFEIPVIGSTISTANEFSDKNKFIAGYYADLTLEWTANETLGLFGGVSAQKLGDYEQELGSRNARIDLGSSVGIRGGISIKF